jgi:hypothetical protein
MRRLWICPGGGAYPCEEHMCRPYFQFPKVPFPPSEIPTAFAGMPQPHHLLLATILIPTLLRVALQNHIIFEAELPDSRGGSSIFCREGSISRRGSINLVKRVGQCADRCCGGMGVLPQKILKSRCSENLNWVLNNPAQKQNKPTHCSFSVRVSGPTQPKNKTNQPTVHSVRVSGPTQPKNKTNQPTVHSVRVSAPTQPRNKTNQPTVHSVRVSAPTQSRNKTNQPTVHSVRLWSNQFGRVPRKIFQTKILSEKSN